MESACRLWLEKQEKAFTAWLNHLLAPPAPSAEGEPGQGAGGGGLAAGRTEARARGALWRLYCGDAEVLGVMTRVEARIEEGLLRLSAEVRLIRPLLAQRATRPRRCACLACVV